MCWLSGNWTVYVNTHVHVHVHVWGWTDFHLDEHVASIPLEDSRQTPFSSPYPILPPSHTHHTQCHTTHKHTHTHTRSLSHTYTHYTQFYHVTPPWLLSAAGVPLIGVRTRSLPVSVGKRHTATTKYGRSVHSVTIKSSESVKLQKMRWLTKYM